MSYCPHAKALYCTKCALSVRVITESFWGSSYYWQRECPFCAVWHSSLDRWEFEGGAWDSLEPAAADSLRPTYGSAYVPVGDPQEIQETSALWSRNAAPWIAACGPQGDIVRAITDPVLVELLGPVTDQMVVDAGCGEGYLARQLASRGARVTGVENASALYRQAVLREQQAPLGIRYLEASISQPFDVPADSVDAVVANNVFMYCPDLPGALAQFARVLRPKGRVVATFTHPCFWGPGTRWATQPPDSPRLEDSRARRVGDYFDRRPHRFQYPGYPTGLIYFPRTLGDYLGQFGRAGFVVTALEEPVPGHHLPSTLRAQYGSVPVSVLVRLERH